MRMTKRQFCINFNMEPQWVDALCAMGKISCDRKKVGKAYRSFIDDSCINNLMAGHDYVECPICKKKMASVTKKHYTLHGVQGNSLYSELYLDSHKKTEDEKKAQSLKLKKRFLTPEGEITRQAIAKASREFNSDPAYKERQKKTFKEVQNRPEMKKYHHERSLKMWSNPEFRAKMSEYVKENIDNLRESARRARLHQKEKSNIHIAYKEKMLEKDLTGFISEYPFGPYQVDEADPLAKIAVEIDGCYWHGCSFCGFKGDVRLRRTDKRKNACLRNKGWLVIRIKEHELKKNPYAAIEMIRNIQAKRRQANISKIKDSFNKGTLKVRSMVNGNMEWVPMSDVLRHHTPHKKMFKIVTEIGEVVVTEDHSLFDSGKNPVRASDIHQGDKITGLTGKEFEPVTVISCEEVQPEKYTYDISVPGSENFVLDSGILAHNSYSISGVSLDIEKSSKYQSMKDEYMNQYDKLVEAAKRSIKIIKGLRQFRYGIGITSSMGPLSRPGVQSRRNWISSGSPTWS